MGSTKNQQNLQNRKNISTEFRLGQTSSSTSLKIPGKIENVSDLPLQFYP